MPKFVFVFKDSFSSCQEEQERAAARFGKSLRGKSYYKSAKYHSRSIDRNENFARVSIIWSRKLNGFLGLNYVYAYQNIGHFRNGRTPLRHMLSIRSQVTFPKCPAPCLFYQVRICHRLDLLGESHGLIHLQKCNVGDLEKCQLAIVRLQNLSGQLTSTSI
jgi:hypothetical protein